MVALLTWCVACLAGALKLAGMVPADDWIGRTLMVFAAGFGLWFALWTTARATGNRL
jgi:hypothetical protein